MASFIKNFWKVSGLTVVSRAAGLARDAALAYVLGAQWVMDAYAIAFRLPNLLRQFLGEGALSAAFIPVFTDYLEKSGPKAANRFMSLVLATVTAALAALVLTADGVLLALRYFTEAGTKWHLIFGLSAVLFPFGILVCLVAVLQAVLNCRGHFTTPALAPIVLNVCIIAGAVAAGVWVADDPAVQVYIIAGAILIAGLLEVAIQVPVMRKLGLLFRPVWDLRDAGLARVVRMVAPMALAVGVVQLNVFFDSLIANLLSPNVPGTAAFHLGSWEIAYPMETGAASVLYYGPLIYQAPLGIFAVALATVIFPLLSRYAVRKDTAGLARTASEGLRLALFIGVPAGVGVILLAEPLIRLFLNHGRFAQAAGAVERTAWVAGLYAVGLWAYSAIHILQRTYYATEDIRTPLRIALLGAGLNLGLNLVLVWPLAERGLAIATVASAAVKAALLAWLLAGRGARLHWADIRASVARTVLVAAVMGTAVWATVRWAAPALAPEGWLRSLAQLGLGTAVGLAVFAAGARALRMRELGELLGRGGDDTAPPLDRGTPPS